MSHLDPEQLAAQGQDALDLIARYWQSLQSTTPPRVSPDIAPGQLLAALPHAAPERPEPWHTIRDDVERLIIPALTHWQHPAFAAYFPANISTPSVLGELISAGLGVNGMLWATSPAATELEIRVLDWLAHACHFPAAFLSTSPAGGGVIQGTASEATLAALVAARHRTRRAAKQSTPNSSPHLTLYTSTQAHSSVIKAAMIAGLADDPEDRTHVRLIDVDPATFAMRPDLLEAAINDDLAHHRIPTFITATIGTTSSTAIDPIPQIAAVIARAAGRMSGLPAPWLHVDAAHAGPMALCPEFRHFFAGLEHADSLCMNPHKWLLTNFDCDCFWTRDRNALTASMSITPDYLRTAQGHTNFRDWHVPLGRRFRALKLWFVLRQFGLAALRDYIRDHITLAADCEKSLAAHPKLEIVAPRTMNLVCFGVRDADLARADARTRHLVNTLNATGDMLLTPTTLPINNHLRAVARVCLGSTTTTAAHARAITAAILAAADRV